MTARAALGPWVAAWLASAVAVGAGCGGAGTTEQDRDRAATASGDSAGQGGEEAPRVDGSLEAALRFAEPRPEPAHGAHVAMAEARVTPGQRLRVPSDACRDVLLLVRDGSLRVSGTGIAPRGRPATLRGGDAVRFGAEGDGVVDNITEGDARAFVAIAVHPTAPRIDPREPAEPRPAPTEGAARACGRETGGTAPGERIVRGDEVEPLVVAGGTLTVRILLDAEQGARHGSLQRLEGTAEARMPEHAHPTSAEVLWVEQAAGDMRVGDSRFTLGGGTMVYMPNTAAHDFRPDGSAPLRALQVYVPAGPEQRFRRMSGAGVEPGSPSGAEPGSSSGDEPANDGAAERSTDEETR